VKSKAAYWLDGCFSGLPASCRAVLLCLGTLALANPALPAFAQASGDIGSGAAGLSKAVEGKFLLEADQLVYDFDHKTVTALGNVKVYYRGYVVDAERLVYDQDTGRLTASGGIRMLEPGGNLVTAEKLDMTDDFRNGFVESINLTTVDQAHFTAQTAEHVGELTIFRRGVYTACQPCLEHPERPPLWQIKAARIIHDAASRTLYYEHARLEFLGVPIAYVPIFFQPDPGVHRKTGLLVPSMLQSDAIGFGVTTPFFWNLAPNYDVTFSPTILSRQGLLMQTEWRHHILNGGYSIRLAGIFQQDPDAFQDDGAPLSGDRDFRGGVSTQGEFRIADDWKLGWDLDFTTDRTFNRDYRIPGKTAKELPSTVYLTGMSDRNYFNMAAEYFRIQREDTEEDLANGDVYVHDDQAEQAFVHPVIDHNYILPTALWGGEFRLDSNLASLTRDQSDISHPPAPFDPYFVGVSGTFTRATSRMSWERRFILPGGQLVSPFTYLQGDVDWLAASDPAAGLEDGVSGRVMPAIGVEYEWPILATLGSSVHTFGPKVQLIARPGEQQAGSLPNEDSQSLEFDDTTLFKWDKFAGYDREEGGTRANVGLTYQGLFPNGASLDALVGQSYQLAGENSFAMRDHALTGIGSGLETDASDYVARVTLNTGRGIAVTARGRFDEDDLALNRGQIVAVGSYAENTASIGYTFLRESPASGIFEQRQELSTSASLKISENWSLLGGLVYDLRNNSRVSDALGIAFANDCFGLSATYSETTDTYSDLVSGRQIFFRISLRTLADGGFSSTLRPDTDTE
jgi:LPS-assembly protein